MSRPTQSPGSTDMATEHKFEIWCNSFDNAYALASLVEDLYSKEYGVTYTSDVEEVEIGPA